MNKISLDWEKKPHIAKKKKKKKIGKSYKRGKQN